MDMKTNRELEEGWREEEKESERQIYGESGGRSQYRQR